MDLEHRLRAAVHAHVTRLVDLHGGLIPAAVLTDGMSFEGTRVSIWNHPKGIFTPRILGPDGAALSIHTSWASKYDDAFDESNGVMTYKYQGSDPGSADNRHLRKACELGLPLVYFVAEYPGVYSAHLPVYVRRDDPTNLMVELLKDSEFALAETASHSAAVQLRREYATREVLQRLHQRDFRKIVLAAYSDRCAICRLGYLPLLDAAHILPDRHPKGEAVVTNGLGLCKIHHSAYDSRILGISPEAKVHIRGDVLKKRDGPMLLHGLQELHGTSLALPREATKRPNKDFLAERFDLFNAA